jgi:cell division protein FtsA
MPRSIVTGIDIGTYNVKVVIAHGSERSEKGMPKILGVGMAESRGMRHGYIVNLQDVVESVKLAVAEAEKRANVKIKKAFVGSEGSASAASPHQVQPLFLVPISRSRSRY